jgi:hypothetical protein
MKKLLSLLLCIVSISCFASTTPISQAAVCPHALPTTNPGFCDSFKSVAYCHCRVEHGMPPSFCTMDNLVDQMIKLYGSIWKACSPQAQRDVPQQECFDSWTYYNSHCKK